GEQHDHALAPGRPVPLARANPPQHRRGHARGPRAQRRRATEIFQRRTAFMVIGRYGALLPLFRLVGVPCIAAFVERGKPTASPRRSAETGMLSPNIANVYRGRESSRVLSAARIWLEATAAIGIDSIMILGRSRALQEIDGGAQGCRQTPESRLAHRIPFGFCLRTQHLFYISFGLRFSV